jgi:hypothetical protein
MAGKSAHNRVDRGDEDLLPELVFDLSGDKSNLSTFGKTEAPMNQLPDLAWDCSSLPAAGLTAAKQDE